MKIYKYIIILIIVPFSLFAQEPMEYNGEWQFNKRHGQGKMIYYDGSVYEGQWLNNIRQGQGNITFQNGESYVGNWVDNKIEGTGTYAFKNGEKFEGQFVNGLPHGSGTFNLKTGDIYSGEVSQGIINGNGQMTFSSGNKYNGSFANGKMVGSGTMNYTTGDIYTGQWSNNQREGHGVQNFANGDVYDGCWKNDKMFGIGVLNKANGEKYVGEFNKEYSGMGRLTTANGDYIEGDFNNGFVDGNATIWYENGEQYKGEVKKGVPEGNGTYFYNNDSYYSGELKKGQPDGMGKLCNASGELIKGGKWSKGSLKKTYEQIDAGRKAFAEGMQALAQGMAVAGQQMQAQNAQMKANAAANKAQWSNYMKESKQSQDTYNQLYQEELNKMNSNPYSKNNPMKETEAKMLASQRMQQMKQTQSNNGTPPITSNNGTPQPKTNYNIGGNKYGSSSNSASNNTTPAVRSGGHQIFTKKYDDGQLQARYRALVTEDGDKIKDGYYETWLPDGTKESESLYVKGAEVEKTRWNKESNFEAYHQLDNNQNYKIYVLNSYFHQSSFVHLLKIENPTDLWEIRCRNNGTISSISYSKNNADVRYRIDFDESGKKKFAQAYDHTFVEKKIANLNVTYENGKMVRTSSGGTISYNNGKRTKYSIKLNSNTSQYGYISGSINFLDGNKIEPQENASEINKSFKNDGQIESDLLPRIKSVEQKAFQLLGSYSKDSFKPQNRN